MSRPSATILFDGVCNLCNGFVQFIIKNDSAGHFRFASLQSEAGQKLLAARGITAPVTDPESVLLVTATSVYSHSTAVLHILRKLGGAWALLYAGIVLPRFMRDAAYRFVARNRYRWFGREEACMLPTPELAKRFL
ncbi:thiol-disulfide oxidoreductase DCC family protein [Hymenobacter sp. GOD-10R]|uniref:thiol-disulfide oxidoreductase DCC family protein n=1 Tax=Hymenobacter sp. GOD-10R TaxID=3093922 RepID=UPI002D77821F|nr:thiol-disulfide oxidoreductase DCC family protein [Hymenobacter sp. GOD-10R]WRQ29989.1 thiol-disulfide oxidoreductase DCC family protein [Hymenobacter sp. GOD-10R]